MKYFLGDNLKLKDRRDRDKVHWGEKWERKYVGAIKKENAKKYEGKVVIAVFTKYGTFLIRKTTFEKHKKRILKSARGYRVFLIKNGKLVKVKDVEVRRKENIFSFNIPKLEIKPISFKGKTPFEIAISKKLSKFNIAADVFDLKALQDTSLSIKENIDNFLKEFRLLAETDTQKLLSLEEDFNKKVFEAEQKFKANPEEFFKEIEEQEKELLKRLQNYEY